MHGFVRLCRVVLGYVGLFTALYRCVGLRRLCRVVFKQ